jgi:hypothetical protein
MKFTLTIDCDNSAFGDDPVPEVGSLLRQAADKVAMTSGVGTLRDSNGNTVGRFHFTED